MAISTRGQRLARRYPILEAAPEEERAKLVRSALFSPYLLVPLFAVGLLVLPLYFEFALRLIQPDQGPDDLFKLGKMGLAVLLPVVIIVPVLTRFAMPALLRRNMKKRGYTPPEA